MKYGHVYSEVFRKPWAILPEKFNTIAEIVTMRAMARSSRRKKSVRV